jgi:hypothetical protein
MSIFERGKFRQVRYFGNLGSADELDGRVRSWCQIDEKGSLELQETE